MASLSRVLLCFPFMLEVFSFDPLCVASPRVALLALICDPAALLVKPLASVRFATLRVARRRFASLLKVCDHAQPFCVFRSSTQLCFALLVFPCRCLRETCDFFCVLAGAFCLAALCFASLGFAWLALPKFETPAVFFSTLLP